MNNSPVQIRKLKLKEVKTFHDTTQLVGGRANSSASKVHAKNSTVLLQGALRAKDIFKKHKLDYSNCRMAQNPRKEGTGGNQPSREEFKASNKISQSIKELLCPGGSPEAVST